jgi:uncharacterized protein (DUF4415 family)
MTATSRQERRRELYALMDKFEWDFAHRATRDERFPDEWREIWQNRSHRKVKTSFWIDEDVVKFYRSLGHGHGPRMNAVLRSFMLARLAGLIESEDLPARLREKWMGRPRPSVTAVWAESEVANGRSQE